MRKESTTYREALSDLMPLVSRCLRLSLDFRMPRIPPSGRSHKAKDISGNLDLLRHIFGKCLH